MKFDPLRLSETHFSHHILIVSRTFQTYVVLALFNAVIRAVSLEFVAASVAHEAIRVGDMIIQFQLHAVMTMFCAHEIVRLHVTEFTSSGLELIMIFAHDTDRFDHELIIFQVRVVDQVLVEVQVVSINTVAVWKIHVYEAEFQYSFSV